jgi:dihydrodipicolinate synthase/N-acetylneuraminate lyase
MLTLTQHPLDLIVRKRQIEGISAILLPFDATGEIDWASFDAQIARTADAQLTPAVNMDTGYVNLLTEQQRLQVLARTRSVMGNLPFVAGAFVPDTFGDTWNAPAVFRAVEAILSHNAIPVIFQSFGMQTLADPELVRAYQDIAQRTQQFIAFELGQMFAPFGRIYSLEVYEALINIPQCIGAKHSSLSRQLEWQRIALRNRLRPEFRVYTGNDLAIDMVMYGSDYLLGISTFAPDLFAKRDQYWKADAPEFYALNDALQYLGTFAFRRPVPAYKHSAAQFLKLRNWIPSDAVHPHAQGRPDSDRAVLYEILHTLKQWE